MSKVDAGAVARAAGGVLGRTLGGVALGVMVGLVAFGVEWLAGLLDGDGGIAVLRWALLPTYVLGAAVALGLLGALRGVRHAATTTLVDSGALRGMVERGLARVRAADARHQAAAAPTDDGEAAPPPSGWLGARIDGIGRATSRAIVARLRSTAAPEAETAATADATARMMIDEWGETASYLIGGGLVLLLVAPPLVLALAT